MAITRVFCHKEWDVTGTKGLAPTWFEGADPTTGRGVAHDILEHFRTDPGETEGECMALGAFMLLRLENGWGSDSRASMSPMGGDVQSILTDIVSQGRRMPRALKSRPLEQTSEDLVQTALREAFRELDEVLENAEEDERDHLRTQLFSAREDIASWIRRGYRKAQRRYSGCDLYSVGMHLFGKVEKLVDRLLRSDSLWEGAKVRVSVDPRRLMTWAHVYDPDTGRWLEDELFC